MAVSYQFKAATTIYIGAYVSLGGTIGVSATDAVDIDRQRRRPVAHLGQGLSSNSVLFDLLWICCSAAASHRTDHSNEPINRTHDKVSAYKFNKCSAVADEMGDRLATTDMGRKLRGCAPLVEGELGPCLTQCGQGRDLLAC